MQLEDLTAWIFYDLGPFFHSFQPFTSYHRFLDLPIIFRVLAQVGSVPTLRLMAGIARKPRVHAKFCGAMSSLLLRPWRSLRNILFSLAASIMLFHSQFHLPSIFRLAHLGLLFSVTWILLSPHAFILGITFNELF